MITYTWTIEDVTVNPSVTIGETTYTDVITDIRWKCAGTEDSYSAFEEQTWPVGFTGENTFIALGDLDVDTVVGWIMSDDERDNQERQVAFKIDKLKNTKTIG